MLDQRVILGRQIQGISESCGLLRRVARANGKLGLGAGRFNGEAEDQLSSSSPPVSPLAYKLNELGNEGTDSR